MESAHRFPHAEFFVSLIVNPNLNPNLKTKGAYGNRTGRRPLPPYPADGSADWRTAAPDRGSGQPARQCGAGAYLLAGSNSFPRSAHGRYGGGHSSLFSLDVAQADVFYPRPVVRFSPLRTLKSPSAERCGRARGCGGLEVAFDFVCRSASALR